MTYGEVAFNAYVAQVGGNTHDGKPIPTWANLTDEIREGWNVAADVIRLRCVRCDRVPTVRFRWATDGTLRDDKGRTPAERGDRCKAQKPKQTHGACGGFLRLEADTPAFADGSCRECGIGLQRKSRMGPAPSICPPCQRRVDTDRQRTRRAAFKPAHCLDCGCSIEQKPTGRPRLVCLSCRRSRDSRAGRERRKNRQ